VWSASQRDVLSAAVVSRHSNAVYLFWRSFGGFRLVCLMHASERCANHFT
jgi:hypothetical protein